MTTYNEFLGEYRKNERGYASIFIIAQSCLGSVAAMAVLMQGIGIYQMVQLFLVVMGCMSFNAAVLAQLPSKITFNIFILSLLVSSLVLGANLI
ncbi:hypothetical protein [Flavobacterium sp. ASW18X]|uniref:hypothetical protein n=1 Tax=Flavobacterium sp. ASW18X TaxID=2572595 RepID=UPI0010ADCBD7|nr:hypothetical protein [Flavobacterium sp. ASW18X]TKD66743.1 hypothetical protein FBT53_02500 [Flavobacterium sp. ASW18X]